MDGRQAPSKCGQCQCRQGRRASSRSNSDADIIPYQRIQARTERKRDRNDGEVFADGILSEPSCNFDSPSSSSVGNFRRRNALRRRSRENVRQNSGNKGIRLGAKPDVIPPIEDDVFFEPAEEEQGVHLGNTYSKMDV